MNGFPDDKLLVITISLSCSGVNSFFVFLSQFEKPDSESRLNSKYLIVGFSSTEIFITPSLLIILISEKRSVLKSD